MRKSESFSFFSAFFERGLKKVWEYGITIKTKEEKEVAQKQGKGQWVVKVMAAVLAVLMVLGVGGTLLYYLIAM